MRLFKTNKIYWFYLLLVLACAFSLIITNFSYDCEYQTSMAYRLLKKDALITQMWEPHQTSAFLCAILMKFYMLLTGTTTGIVVYLQFCGFAIRILIALYLYRVLRRQSDEIPALIAAFFYLFLSPKDLLIPEFSNMQLWFGTLTALTLVDYLRCDKVRYLILSAICLCLGVFSYPSFLLAYPAVCFLLFRYSRKKWQDTFLFTGVCALIGGSFVIYLLIKVGLVQILECVPRAFALEPTHTVSMTDKLLSHVLELLAIAALLLATFTVGLLAEYLRSRNLRGNLNVRSSHLSPNSHSTTNSSTICSFSRERGLLIGWFLILLLFLVDIVRARNTGLHAYLFLAIIFPGILYRKELSAEGQMTYDCGILMGAVNLTATLLLSDHGALRAVPYTVTAVCFSVLPLRHCFAKAKDSVRTGKYFLWGVHLLLLLIAFRCLYIHVPIYGREQICSLSSDLALIRSGPAMGLVTDEAGAAKQRDSMAEWKQYIKPGDTIWILGEPVDSLGYLYEDVEVGAPTVMSTPTYNEQLLYYWELNPEKYPDVVIVESSFGTLSWVLQQNEWLMNWLEEEYQAQTIIDGNYWRYYFKTAP